MKDLEKLSELMDNKFEGPFGFKFGLDGLIGLVPIAGDIFTTIISLYIIVRAIFLKVSFFTILRMIFNVLLETLIDFIPYFGNLFDFYWRANKKNIEILKKNIP